MNKTSLIVSVALTVLLFYYVISIYQCTVPGSAKWLVQGRIIRHAAELLAAQNSANTQTQTQQ